MTAPDSEVMTSLGAVLGAEDVVVEGVAEGEAAGIISLEWVDKIKFKVKDLVQIC